MKRWKRYRCLALIGLITVGLGSSLVGGPNLIKDSLSYKFWYPPYATEKPVYKEGKLTLNLEDAYGAKIALLKIDLPEGMEKGKEYVFSVDASSSVRCGLRIIVPEPNAKGELDAKGKVKGRVDRKVHGKGFVTRGVQFRYDPDIVGTQISFMWLKGDISKAAIWEFRNFSLSPVISSDASFATYR